MYKFITLFYSLNSLGWLGGHKVLLMLRFQSIHFSLLAAYWYVILCLKSLIVIREDLTSFYFTFIDTSGEYYYGKWKLIATITNGLYLMSCLRLTIVYALVLGFIATLIVYMGTGPNWYNVIASSAGCRVSWWKNFLYSWVIADLLPLPVYEYKIT